MSKIQSIRGMRSILPEETPVWQWLESKVRSIAWRYGYQEVRLPILEPVSLFERAVGESTDIVSKEMYNFLDKSGEHITLRPEGTSGCVRAVVENNMCYNTTQRLWYQGPMFRYERPQKGRLRQFTQFGVETFGMPGADIDAELIYMAWDIFKALKVDRFIRLEINSLGTLPERKEHRQQLVSWFNQHHALLDEDSLRRLETNPLRILDSKNPQMQEMIEGAPRLLDFLGDESREHFNALRTLLDNAGISYVINPRLVRGLDYYTRTVFEWITDELGAQGTVCGGGRYDGLVELFSDKQLPASGFAIGIERLLLLLQTTGGDNHIHNNPDIVVTYEDPQQNIDALLLAHTLRQHLPAQKIFSDFSGSRLKRQHSNALKSGCRFIVTLNGDRRIGLWDLAGNRHETLRLEEVWKTISAASKLAGR
ncbi:histidine--tRNA ligase [Erwinia sorbitola]|uniref:Histidine--tRNA ligase n=1 Tax=Erwinia sorbitola TaxID=2681984 RepID=A0A6I6EWP5_9GAMM|nr:histidine--tRNA ligase [Erwinia sorbitola]MTD27211.1 histidine--tRNA ligase [Erwinia sorbitola]QGU88763.1 histidine--tRNA ligase [Erwinia sorbitola]